MALVTVQRSPSPSGSAEEDDVDTPDAEESTVKSPRQRRRSSRSALKKLRKLFNSVRFVSKLKPGFSESYFTVKGAALILPQSDYETAFTRKVTKSHGGDIQSHLQAMFSLLRPLDTIKVAVKLEGTHDRYLVVVSCIGRQDTEESVILGVDLLDQPVIGFVMPVWAHTDIKLDGDGGFSIESSNETHLFKPVSVQAMWSALQSLNKVVKLATDKLYLPRGLTHTWLGYYETKVTLDSVIVSEWNANADIDQAYHRVDKSKLMDKADEDSIYKRIKTELKLVMMSVDLEEVTCRFLRESIEKVMGMDLLKYKSFIDMEMLEILGQMDAPSEVLDYLYLGSEWNASNLEELQHLGVNHILNISREIDNFFPGILHYYNVREWDVEGSNLLKYWKDTHKYINKARQRGSKALVHCKMGISRSASTVIAYLMKERDMSRQEAFDFTKAKRSIINPNCGFWKQLEVYEGILVASRKKRLFDQEARDGGMSTMKEEDEPEMGAEFETAEDLIAMSIGKDAVGPSDLPLEFDNASRSADSTEEMADDEASRRHSSRRVSTLKTESGDYSDYSDMSDTTESDNVSSAGEEDDANAHDVPAIEVNQAGKDHKRDVDRRSNSESDKHSLTIDGRLSAGSKESGIAKKIKPDGSWIKLEPDEEDLVSETSQQKDSDQKVSDHESDDGLWMGKCKVDKLVCTDDVIAEAEERNDNEESSAAAADVKVEPQETDSVQSDDSKELGPYTREKIPFNAGTVLKQKQDLEQKYGTSSPPRKRTESVESGDGAAAASASPSATASADNKESAQINSPVKSAEPVKMDVEISNQQVEPMACDIVIQSEESVMETDQSGAVEGSGSPKGFGRSPRSVYDMEEIDLPEGIVQKTRMEIEERNKLSAETPVKRIQRSSSLKSIRVTPKAKDRDNERRKTCCVASLTPSHSQTTLSPTAADNNTKITTSKSATCLSPSHQYHGDYFEFEGVQELQPMADDLQQGGGDVSLDQAGAVSGQAAGEQEEESLTGIVKTYKYLGEELTVQEGMVRKQTQDIEHKAMEPIVRKVPPKLDLEPNIEEPIPVTSDRPTVSECSKQTPLASSTLTTCSSPNSTDIYSSTDIVTTISDTEAKNENIDDSSYQTVEDIKASLYDKGIKDSEDAGRTCIGTGTASTTPFTPRKASFAKMQSRFDPQTLELIREIGSALLNSPAKEESEEVLEGDSLVSHYVRKIERNVTHVKKRPAKEIIIIEKGSACANEQGPNIASGADSAALMQSGHKHDSNEIKADSPKWSPVAKKPMFYDSPNCDDRSASPKSTGGTVISPKWSPVSRKQTFSPVLGISSPPSETQTPEKTKAKTFERQHNLDQSSLFHDSKTTATMETSCCVVPKDLLEDKEEEAEVCSVKNLVGKFEIPDSVSGNTVPVFGAGLIKSSAMLPNVNMDIEVIDLDTSASAARTGSMSGLEQSARGQSSPQKLCPLRHRKTEPAIHLSETSLQMFDKRLREVGSSLNDKLVLSEESETDNGGSSDQAARAARPKSAGQSATGQGEGQRSGSFGANKRKGNLRQSQTLPDSETSAQPQVVYEGRKVRKLHGKSHPLTKLEDRNYLESIRTNPFYNTM